jgi:hypothetical protein
MDMASYSVVWVITSECPTSLAFGLEGFQLS